MKRLIYILAMLVFSVGCFAFGIEADARPLRVKPDGNVRFNASMDGPTRISVAGDRIAKIIQTDTQFEMSNDRDTGDVFLRFIGSESIKEAGYIVTESGHTVSFTLTPLKGAGSQTVLIELVGLPKPIDEIESDGGDDGFEVDSASSGTGHANDLVTFTREAFNKRIGFTGAGSVKSKGVFKTYAKGGFRASMRSVSATQGLPSPQAFYTQRTLAVFIDDVTDAGRIWVIVVEAK